jgi:hypothetical protein
MVDDVIGLAGDNHGTTALGVCAGGCPPGDWQQANTARFIGALNSGAETFPGISYTEIYSHTDEVVMPNQNDHGTSSLHGGGGMITNVATQDLCPADVYEHLTIGTVDPVAAALALDALTHPGPAKLSRIPSSVCGQTYMPGVDPLNANTYIQVLASQPGLLAVDVGGVNIVGVPEVNSEPALPCYVFASCHVGGALGPRQPNEYRHHRERRR